MVLGNQLHFVELKLEGKTDYFDHITSLTWRMEAILQTRASLVKKAEPIVTVNLKLKDTLDDLVFEADPRLIDSFTEELEQALKFMKGKEVKRLQKHL